MALEILAGPLFEKTYGGADCTSCDCPVYQVCDCQSDKCLLDFAQEVISRATQKASNPLDQVMQALNDFMGFAFFGTKIAPSYDYDPELETGTPTVDYGRTYLYNLLKHYDADMDSLIKKFSRILEMIDPGHDVTTNCNTCTDPYCTTVHCLLQTLRDFIKIQTDPRFHGDLDLFRRPDRCCSANSQWCGDCQ